MLPLQLSVKTESECLSFPLCGSREVPGEGAPLEIGWPMRIKWIGNPKSSSSWGFREDRSQDH